MLHQIGFPCDFNFHVRLEKKIGYILDQWKVIGSRSSPSPLNILLRKVEQGESLTLIYLCCGLQGSKETMNTAQLKHTFENQLGWLIYPLVHDKLTHDIAQSKVSALPRVPASV